MPEIIIDTTLHDVLRATALAAAKHFVNATCGVEEGDTENYWTKHDEKEFERWFKAYAEIGFK
jgi:hypothetical protein